MKKIEAIIRKTKFEEVKEALKEINIEFFSYWDVRGIGKTHEARIYRGISYDTSTIERTMLTIVVRDKNLKKTIDCILVAAKTGEVGDGKIFVSDMISSYRIRTGEEGDSSLFIEGEEA
jgi:nitrogen regulatory protein P-II 1